MWGVIMSLTQITYMKINYIIQKFLRIKRFSFLSSWKQNENYRAVIVEDPCKISQEKFRSFLLRFKAPEAQ